LSHEANEDTSFLTLVYQKKQKVQKKVASFGEGKMNFNKMLNPKYYTKQK